jgi:IPT/TIG domain
MKITIVNGPILYFEVFICLVVLCAASAFGQAPPYHLDVQQAITSDTSPPLRELAARTVTIPGQAAAIFLGRIPYTSSGPAQPDPVLQASALGTQSFAPVQNLGFEGLGNGFPGFAVQYAPPDTNGAVGDTQYVQWVNTSFAIFDKNGNLLQGPTPGNTPWQGFGGGCEKNNDGDPIVQFDKAAHRWIFTQFSVSNKPYLQCFAVSTTPDATGPYFRFAFSFGNKDFPDYPKLGVWSDAYYLSFNIFGNGFFFAGPRACAVDRTAVLAGTAPTMICYQLSSSIGSLLPSDLDGSTPPPAGSPNYFLSFATNSVQVFKFKPNFANPASSSFSGPTNLAVAPFTPVCNGGACIPQQGTSQKLDSLADRLMYRAAYRNFGDHESLVVNHSIQTVGAASAIRWYELRIASQTPTVYQRGTYAPDSLARWMGSVAMDQAGNMLVGYSTSGTGDYPGIRVAGRAPGDPAGSLQPETTLISGGGSQTGGLNRWGDYSSMSIDPVDDCTFWFTTEYLKSSGSFNWSTNIARIKFDGCGAPAPAHDVAVTSITAPAIVNAGGTANVDVNVASLGTSIETVSLSVVDSGGNSVSCPSPFSLNAGTNSAQTCTWTTSASSLGSHTLTATASIATDADTSNNSKSTNSFVARHDVSVSGISAPSSVTQGASANVSVTVNNLGNVNESSVSLTGSVDAAGGSLTCPSGFSLSAGASVIQTCSWNTTSATVDTHSLTATAGVASDANAGNNSMSVNVGVTAPPIGVIVTSISPNSTPAGISVDVTITGSGFATGASVTFENGSGPAPTAIVTSVSATQIAATITTRSGGPPRARTWDVRVTNPDGSTGIAPGGFTVTP